MGRIAYKVCFMSSGKLYSNFEGQDQYPLKVGEWIAAPRDGFWVAVSTRREAMDWLKQKVPYKGSVNVPVLPNPFLFLKPPSVQAEAEASLKIRQFRPLVVEVESPKPWRKSVLPGIWCGRHEKKWAKTLGEAAVYAAIMKVNRFVATA